ncbi:MAG: DUF790 family protein [Chloroflexota bacterium]
MLKSELIKPRIKVKDGQVQAKRLPVEYAWLDICQDLIGIYKQHVGKSRGILAAVLKSYEGDSLNYQILRGLTAVLDTFCTFANDLPIQPALIREHLFKQGATVGADRETRLKETAVAYKLTPKQIETALFADLAEEQLLTEFHPPAPANLIHQYNLEVARGVLYWSKEMHLHVEDSYKDLFKFIKLFKLMHTVTPAENGYDIVLDGPISPFVSSTIRYGLQFAKFLPALLLCEQWEMQAKVRPQGQKSWLNYELDDSTDLKTHFKPSGPYDSRLEADFAAEFAEKYGRSKRTWELNREDELILIDGTVMIPDFSFTHAKDGRRALLEIIGFWHPDYLRRKLQKVRQANRKDLILLVYESANVSAEPFREASAGEVVTFRNKPVLKHVIEAVERSAG